MRPKILIIDDEKTITDSLLRFLKFEGYEVDSLNDPLRALKAIEDVNYMVVICDISMPGKSGIELLGEIKEYNGMIQVIMITGFVTMENILSCLRLGASDCLFKPLDLDALKEAVDGAEGKIAKWEKILKGLQKGRKG